MGRHKTGSIQQRGLRSFRISYTDNSGIRQQETIIGERADAERELAIRIGELAKGLPVSSRPNTILFEELAADVITDYKLNGYDSLPDIDARLRLHILPVFGKRRACQITTAHLKWYAAKRKEEGAAAGTVNRELEAIRHTYLLAVEAKRFLRDLVPHVPMLKENNVRSGFFTREEVAGLTAHLKPEVAAMVWFGFLTGWRLEECRNLKWSNVDFARGEIRLDAGTTKNNDGRVFPMSAELRALLEARAVTSKNHASQTPQRIGEVHKASVPAFTQQVFAGVGSFKKSWKTACYKAGLPCTVKPIEIRGHLQRNKDGTPKVKIIKCHRTFHDLRRSFAREMSNRGVREGAIMKLAGWKTRSVFDRYSIVSEADLRDAIEKLDAEPIGPDSVASRSKTDRKRGPKL